MSRRRNGTNRAGAATGGNRYQGGYNKPQKSTAGAGTPSGAEVKNLRNNYNIQVPEEQEKMLKIMELLQLAVRINGLDVRKQELTGNLPTVFVWFNGHVAGISFRVCRTGWKTECDEEAKELYTDAPLNKFNEEYSSIKAWLLDIKETASYELV